MYTLILLYKILDEYPVILAENRDAHTKSVEIPPSIVSHNPNIYAAIDKKSGGTWFGANEFGVVSGLTNLYSGPYSKKPADSRGRLLMEALKTGSATEMSDYLWENHRIEKYKRANIISADEEQAFLTICNDDIEVDELDCGIHIIANYDYNRAPSSGREVDDFTDSLHREDRTEKLIAEYDVESAGDIREVIDSLKIILSDHENPAGSRGSKNRKYFSICCHGDEKLYPWRTTSSSIFALSEKGLKNSIYLYSPNNPCNQDSFEDYSHILRD